MVDSSSSLNSLLLDPEYIQFLLDPVLQFSCYFVVGNPQLAPVEKIGVIKKMLAAHSEVFRTQLLSQQWESKEPEKIIDILPATFKNLLRFVYGFDTTSTMSFEDADDLLYAADRYIMNRLKDKLATRLMSLLDYSNICSLLTNPACARVLELNSEMNKILQCETDKVLASPQFLSCCPDTFVKILEQEVMNVTELDVWRAALSWAKNKGTISDAKTLRQQLEKPLHHIRVCTLSPDEFCKEVVPTGILTDQEVGAVCTAVVTKNVPETLTTVCSNKQVRRAPVCSNMQVRRAPVCSNKQVRRAPVCSNMQVRRAPAVECVKSQELLVRLRGIGELTITRQFSFSLQTHSLAVEIMRLKCYVNRSGQFTMTVKIETDQNPATTVTHTDNSTGWQGFYIPVSTEERPVVLSPNTQYTLTLSCDAEFSVYRESSAEKTGERLTVQFTQHNGVYGTPLCYIYYKTLTPQ